MKSPEMQGHGTKNLGDMREWISTFSREGSHLIRYDTIINRKQFHTFFESKDVEESTLERLREKARAELKSMAD